MLLPSINPFLTANKPFPNQLSPLGDLSIEEILDVYGWNGLEELGAYNQLSDSVKFLMN
jgi:hypothetical protein